MPVSRKGESPARIDEELKLKVVSSTSHVSTIKLSQVRCCICNRLHDRSAFGAGHEIGRGRRFCPYCMSDLLRRNGIKEDDFPPDDE
jgi:hypothetical protein